MTEEIMKEVNGNPIASEAWELINKIHGKEVEVMVSSKILTDVENKMAEIEKQTKGIIATAETPEGKKKYSNKTMREAELQMRLNNNEKYQELKEERSDLQQNIEKSQIKSKHFLRQLSVLKRLLGTRRLSE